MSERPRLYFDVDDRLRWAMRLKAGKDNVPALAVLARLAVEKYVATELAEVDAKLAQGEAPKKDQSKRGRRPKRPRD